MPLTGLWRRYRREAQQHFRQDAVAQYHSIQLEKVHKMSHGLLETPELFDHHNKL